MAILTLHIENSDQEAAIRTILDGFHVRYVEGDDIDTTDYLLSSPANAEHLQKSIEQAERGETVKIDYKSLLPR